MNLLVDIGNTRLKWGRAHNGEIIAGSPFLHARINRLLLADVWKDIGVPEKVAVSCVSSEDRLELVRSVADELWPSIDFVKVNSQARGYGVVNAYSQPETLGVDRWLALVAVRHRYRLPACIVDCGTAITLDMINAAGLHRGGLICPGLTLMKKSLSTATVSLKFNDTRYKAGLANSTSAAIYSGSLLAVVGLIEHVLSSQPEDCSLILTGGDAELVADQFAQKLIVDADLVLRGLAIVLKG
ncbi:MAG: type III pantothenate kinase [Gammaproteobacteria bacterium]